MTPMPGPTATQGVVVGDYEVPTGSNQIRGFYIQDLTGDGNVNTSDGIFVFTGNNGNFVVLGDLVYVQGTATEFENQTQIANATISRLSTAASSSIGVPTDSCSA
jgi:predicted extracellular nuclease